MEKELQQLREEATKLCQNNVRHTDMSVQNNFDETEKIKNEITSLHLKIIYENRSTVLVECNNFENAIGEDREAKNRFRVEIAKYIFTDSITGYISDFQAADLSVNPVVNIAEKIASRN